MRTPPNVRKPFSPKTRKEARRCHVDLVLSDAELAQIDKLATDMKWTRLDVIRNCLANGTKDIETFVKGCDSPVISTAWKLALMLSNDDDRKTIHGLMENVESTRANRHADLLEPQLYDDDQLADQLATV